jgi:hypothetical protein
MINVAKAEINVNFSPVGGVDNHAAGYGDQDTPKAQDAKGFDQIAYWPLVLTVPSGISR